MKIYKYASAVWNGPVPTGTGSMRLGKNGGSLAYSLKSRVEDTDMTNPEELVGAALAGCFSMHLTSLIEDAGKKPGVIDASAKVTLEQRADGFWISEIQLIARGSGQELSNEEFVAFAEKAKATCPVSKLYSSALITLDAALA
jgi:osmotically inducible protein OsmC